MSGGGSRGHTSSHGNGLAEGAGQINALTPNENFGARPHPKRTGEVYFVSDGEHIKIGYSTAPKIRVADLQVSSGRELVLLGTISGGLDTERRLHARFAHCRVRGEWFSPTPELTAFIAAACAVSKKRILQPHLPEWYRRISPEVARLKAWAQGRSDVERNRADIIGKQMMLAAKYQENKAVAAALQISVRGLAAAR